MELEKYDNETVSSIYFDYAKEKLLRASIELSKEIDYIKETYHDPHGNYETENILKRLSEVSNGIDGDLFLNIENVLSSTDNEDVLKLLARQIDSLVEKTLILNGLLSELRTERDIEDTFLQIAKLYSIKSDKAIKSLIGSVATITNLADSLGVKVEEVKFDIKNPFL